MLIFSNIDKSCHCTKFYFSSSGTRYNILLLLAIFHILFYIHKTFMCIFILFKTSTSFSVIPNLHAIVCSVGVGTFTYALTNDLILYSISCSYRCRPTCMTLSVSSLNGAKIVYLQFVRIILHIIGGTFHMIIIT